MPRKKQTDQSSSKKSQKNSLNDNPPQSVALPFREAYANRAAERAAKQGKEPPPATAAPTIQRPRRNIVEKTYSVKDGPVPLNRNAPVVDPEIPCLPGQEDIPPSPKGSGHATTHNSQVTPDANTHPDNGFETSAEPASHPFGQPEYQTGLNYNCGDEDSAILCNNTLINNGFDFSGANWPGPALGDPGNFEFINTNTDFQPLANSMPLPGTIPTSYTPNLGNPPVTTPQSTLNSAQFNPTPNTVTPSAEPAAYPSFLEQLGHTPHPESGLATLSSAPQYVVNLPANLETPTPTRTVLYQSAPTYQIPSYQTQNPPVPEFHGATRGLPTTTPSRKNIQANRVDFFAEQRKFRGRKKKQIQPPAHASSAEEGDQPSTSGTHVVNNSAVSANYDDVKPIIRKAVFFELVSVEPWPLQVGSLREAVFDFIRTTPGGSALAAVAAEDPKLNRKLRSLMANVRGDAYTYSHLIIKQTYDISPKSKNRLDRLLEDKKFHFLYPKETKVSSKEIGFCCHEAVSRVVCAILFDSPAGLGTLYMDRLCAFDKAEPWHDERRDKSDDARRGVPIGLIAFAGTLIFHVLECVRDDVPGAKQKRYKFEGSRYKKTWSRIHSRLVKDRFLGKLRVDLLKDVKARYNEINNNLAADTSSDSSDSSSSSSSSDNEGGADSGPIPEAGPSAGVNDNEMEQD
ncbi:hypothetical protein FRC10_001904 [Ceratobasidium sp. 414]|nr:hypothetical protein FRC10_001904 [Ceratobasidium sp. 414]